MQQAVVSPTLKDRIFHSRASSAFRPLNLMVVAGRPKRYKSWDSDRLEQAYTCVQKGELTIRQAAEAFEVPKSTLHDRLSGKVAFGKLSGPCRYLSDSEEDELVNFLTECSKVGYARSKKEVIELVQATLKTKGKIVNVTGGWFESFKRRHPKVTLRSAEPLAYSRAVASDPNIFERYYDILEQTLHQNDLIDKPCQIFNCDETGMPLSPTPPKVVTSKGDKHPYAINSGNKAQITVLACCSAAGYVIPPLVVFDRKILKPEMAAGEVHGTMYGLSSSGWMDSELFNLWFEHHFLLHAPSARPLILLLDGHSSHFEPSFIQKAAAEQVVVFCMPPHTTHVAQPLDNGIFSPLKRYWREECQKYSASNPGRVVTRLNFSHLFCSAWHRSMTMGNIAAGFSRTGVYPFNRYALCPEVSKSAAFDPLSLSQKTGLKYIPLYSPARHSVRQPVCPVEEFTVKEIVEFQKLYESRCGISSARYKKWLSMYHPGVPLCGGEASVCEPELDKDDSFEYSLPCDGLGDVNGCIEKGSGKGEEFTPDELVLYQRRYEENYDLPDGRYELWLSKFHPLQTQSCVAVNPPVTKPPAVVEPIRANPQLAKLPQPPKHPVIAKHAVVTKPRTVLSKLLENTTPVYKLPDKSEPKNSARVLTSSENLKLILEKKRKKDKEAKEKEERKLVREEKRMAREEAKRNKKANVTAPKQSIRAGTSRSGKISCGKAPERSSGDCSSGGRTLSSADTPARSGKAPERSSGDCSSGGRTLSSADTPARSGKAPEKDSQGSSSGGRILATADTPASSGKQKSTSCSTGTCGHPLARNWVSCSMCETWFHCTCVGVQMRRAKEERFTYICVSCKH